MSLSAPFSLMCLVACSEFSEVLRSVAASGLAAAVARLKARFVIKDADKADD